MRLKQVIYRVLIIEIASLLGAIACSLISLHIDCWNVILLDAALEDCFARGSPSGLINAAFIGGGLAVVFMVGVLFPEIYTRLDAVKPESIRRDRGKRLLAFFGLVVLSVVTLTGWSLLILGMIPTLMYGAQFNGSFWRGLLSLALLAAIVTIGGLGIFKLVSFVRPPLPNLLGAAALALLIFLGLFLVIFSLVVLLP